jgi:hypothetical protein
MEHPGPAPGRYFAGGGGGGTYDAIQASQQDQVEQVVVDQHLNQMVQVGGTAGTLILEVEVVVLINWTSHSLVELAVQE